MSAIAYLRRSSAPNGDSRSVSFEMQEAAVRELAAHHDDAISAVLSDWAKSGGSARRPGYQQVLAGIEAGSITTIYGYSLSRLSRSIVDFAHLMERCRKHGVAVRLVRDGGMDWSTASGRAFAQMAAVFAQFERELATERIESAYAARRERGDVLGQAPYGYRIVQGQLGRREDEDPMEVVATFREAGSFGRAARLLNERGVKTRRAGATWNHGVVADIVRQQAPPDLAVPLASRRAKAKPLTGTMLAGLLRCGSCGVTLTPRRYHDVVTYYCNRSYRIPGHGKTTVREAAILPWMRQEAARLRTPEYVSMQEVDPEHAAIKRRRDRILQMFEDGDIDRHEKSRRVRQVDEAAALLAAKERIVAVPTLDWSAPPDDVNGVLRAMWDHVKLDKLLMPVCADWLVPEWRAP